MRRGRRRIAVPPEATPVAPPEAAPVAPPAAGPDARKRITEAVMAAVGEPTPREADSSGAAHAAELAQLQDALRRPLGFESKYTTPLFQTIVVDVDTIRYGGWPVCTLANAVRETAKTCGHSMSIWGTDADRLRAYYVLRHMVDAIPWDRERLTVEDLLGICERSVYSAEQTMRYSPHESIMALVKDYKLFMSRGEGGASETP